MWVAFVMSTAMAGLAGSLSRVFEAFISPFDFNLEMSLFYPRISCVWWARLLEWGDPWGCIARRDFEFVQEPQHLSTLDLRACLSPRGFPLSSRSLDVLQRTRMHAPSHVACATSQSVTSC